MMNIKKLLALMALFMVLANVSFFAGEDIDQIMEQREANFKNLKKQTKVIKKLLNSSQLDQQALAKAGNEVEKSAKLIPSFFPESTKEEIDSEAEPDIWEDFSGFQGKAGGLAESAVNFVTAVNTNDKKQIKQAYANIGKSCKACHKEYRK